MKNQMFANIVEKMRNQFLPLKDETAHVTMDGTIVVRTNTANGKEWIGQNAAGETVAYPEEMVIDFPLYTVARTIDQIKAGDIVKATSSTYSRVEKIEDGKVHAVSFGGNVRKVAPIKDFFLGQATLRVVVNPFAGAMFGGQNNMLPLIMMLDNEEDNNGSMLEMLVLSQAMNPGAAGNILNNHMMLMMLMKDGGKDALLPLLFMQNGGNFANFFNPVKKED